MIHRMFNMAEIKRKDNVMEMSFISTFQNSNSWFDRWSVKKSKIWIENPWFLYKYTVDCVI